MAAYYNEVEPFAAQWLRNLIAENLIAPGVVDERSIHDVQPADLAGFTQCHFFAGLGGWSRAMRLAGWPDDRPVWTGSCPCQPFSVAGKQAGFDDPRHLWPQFRRLISERQPATVFGEQVAGASDWLRIVRGDLEAMDYAVGAVPVEAASAGAKHRRDRYWFVANTNSYNSERWSGPVQMGREWGAGETEQVVQQDGDEWAAEPQPGTLAYGVPARMEQLRAYGNAIDPRPAAAFIGAAMECLP
jgi:DNA (cytosine-5)-methyltransferase 1